MIDLDKTTNKSFWTNAMLAVSLAKQVAAKKLIKLYIIILEVINLYCFNTNEYFNRPCW